MEGSGSGAGLPEFIQHYRILARIGAGGMGQVFLAHDSRLDRKVAIKRLHQNRERDEVHRERFRREARLAARLNHPNIVQIYEFFEFGDRDHLVMEYVTGPSLKTWLSQGQAFLTTVGVLREVALGLAHAHRLGVIHRDLKTENVLITEEGTAKIADFGLARWASPPLGEAALTQSQMMLGTYRTMSPEQARGEDTDARSDYFAFGVLCYEVLTGQSPFLQENPLATLNRIANDHPPPPAELNPAIPDKLSRLIQRLLDKDPMGRPTLVGEVLPLLEVLSAGRAATDAIDWDAATTHAHSLPQPDHVPRWRMLGRLAAGLVIVGMLALAFVVSQRWRSAAVKTRYVAVFETRAGDELDQASAMASGVRVALIRGILGKKGLAVLAAEELDREQGTLLQRAKALAADEMVTSQLNCADGTCQLTLHRVAVADGGTMWSKNFAVPANMPAMLARVVEAQVRDAFDDFPSRQGIQPFAVSEQDYAAFMKLHVAYTKDRQNTSPDDILDGLHKIQATSPNFLDAYLLEIRVSLFQFNETRRAEYLAQAEAAANRARQVAPSDPEPIYGALVCALTAKVWDRATSILADLARLDPGNARLFKYKAQLLESQGQAKQALVQMRDAAALQPSWRILFSLARMEARQGEVEAARNTLKRLLERAPENYFGLMFAAQIELLQGSLPRAVELLETLTAKSPGFVELSALGLAHFLSGDYELAGTAYEKAREMSPDNPLALFNLGDAYLVIGKEEDAMALYRQTVSSIDAKSADWQDHTVLAQAYAHLDESDKAVAAINTALKLAPENNQTAYEAAVVYALLGDHASAAYHAERALELGYQMRMFGLPWFDGLRKDGRFPVVTEINRNLGEVQ